jgi:DNA-binding XRE family transcriptional regulator
MKSHPQEWNDLAASYSTLGTIQKAADSMGISFSTARNRLLRMGIEINAKGPASWRVVITGAQCREKRIELGLTQPDLAKRSSTTVATISNFENGNRTPREATQIRLAEAMGIEIEPEGA